VARDGEDAVAKARELKPDVVTMDINMPKLDGISALQIILAEKICPVVMVSSLTQRGATHHVRMPGVRGVRFRRQTRWHGVVANGRGGRGAGG
jgi:chemotaxis response regulator CheB